MDTIGKPSSLLFRHHVRRPRLTRLLNASAAQAIVLTAPAGYGKTTLTAEWLQGSERVAWYRPTAASADVAAFSIELCDAASGILSAGDRLRQRLRVAEAPERAVRQLAELLAEDFAEWPRDAWLVIDDYHLVSQSTPVEDFVDWLLTLAPLRLVVTTRRRPAWTSARRLLYGEIFEITQHHLAMTADEARQALAHHSTASIVELVEAAQGWPALIGLAAVSHSAEMPPSTFSEVLFRYFADEVLRQQPPDLQAFMLAAAAPARLTPDIVKTVLEVDDGEKFLTRLRDEGLLHASRNGIVFHPLVRDFLRRRLEDVDPTQARLLYDRAVAYARSISQWDDAFELAFETGRVDLAAIIVGEASPSLLASGRLETVAKWFEAVGPTVLDCPQAVLARAETLTRLGKFSEAEALIEPLVAALGSDDANGSRAWYLLGHARHLTSDYRAAVACHRNARSFARSRHEEATAAWGALISAAELEPQDLMDYLTEFERLAGDDADSRLRVACGRQLAAEHRGTLAGTWDGLRCALTLTPLASDPMAVSNALANASCLNVARGEYDLALRLANDALSFCSTLRLDFAIGYCLVYRGAAEIGRRDFTAARKTLDELAIAVNGGEDPHLALERSILSLKLTLATEGMEHDISDMTRRNESFLRVPCASHGKYLALQALAFARSGSTAVAREKAHAAVDITLSPEARCLARFADVAAAIADAASLKEARELAVEAFIDAESRECLDPVVVAYRAYPPILRLLGEDPRLMQRLEQAFVRSNDIALVRQMGIALRTHGSSGARLLTKREQEVMELLAAGLTTAEIARRLFISTSTTKVHIHHILEKLEVKTRLQAVLKWRSLEDGK